MNERQELIIGLSAWAVMFIISPIVAVILAIAGWLFMHRWQQPEKKKDEREKWQYYNEHGMTKEQTIKEMFWNDEP